jgi:hypothetical protein
VALSLARPEFLDCKLSLMFALRAPATFRGAMATLAPQGGDVEGRAKIRREVNRLRSAFPFTPRAIRSSPPSSPECEALVGEGLIFPSQAPSPPPPPPTRLRAEGSILMKRRCGVVALALSVAALATPDDPAVDGKLHQRGEERDVIRAM